MLIAPIVFATVAPERSDHFLFEVIDPDTGKPVADGESGELVITTLSKQAMPMIRYRTRDITAIHPEPCGCGRTYRTLKRIIGRIEDVVITPDHRYVGRLDAAFKYSPGIRLSQIVQETSDEIVVNIVRASSYNSDDEKTLLRELRTRLGEEIRITLRFVDEIPAGNNGKLKFVISKPGRQALQALHA